MPLATTCQFNVRSRSEGKPLSATGVPDAKRLPSSATSTNDLNARDGVSAQWIKHGWKVIA
eukprot:m.247295 g.247295  ORF g.247295 m.247295 type:complete len:61 (-) comp19496_c0_seq2:1452-1634(-)